MSVDPPLAQRAGIKSNSETQRSGPQNLTPREQDVFELLRQGLTNREIARSLWIEETTAKVHVRNILRKLAAKSRTEAATIGGDLLKKRLPPEAPAG